MKCIDVEAPETSHHNQQRDIKFEEVTTESQKNKKRQQQKLINVALVSDFYLPFVGGVQMHIKQLACRLREHYKIGNLIVITHKYDHHSLNYTGVQNHHGFKVYYLNVSYSRQLMIIYPTFAFNFRKAAQILRQQKIDIVHCHQTGSTLSLQFIFFARILGLRVILTEHSLYGFRSLSEIHFNRACQFFLLLCDKAIAVSRTTKNNLVLRTNITPGKVVVIPNGVSDVTHILQKKAQKLGKQIRQQKDSKIIKIITVGRMTYRRGTDLLIEILPELCKRNENIQILIVGDGLKRKVLEKIIQINNLYTKVRLLGIISDHDKLLEIMSECDIFLNTPLTQSFGIALAEAAMLGLYCVSTNVGGVEEAIPKQYLFSSSVCPSSLLDTLCKVINKVKNQQRKVENKVKFEYPWSGVCERTVQLYQYVMKKEKKSRKYWLMKVLKTGNFFELFFALLSIILFLIGLLPFFS